MTDIQEWINRAMSASAFVDPPEAVLVPLNALQAVLDLHKPYGEHSEFCEACDHPQPCLTVQAIQDALRDEQDHPSP